MPRWERGALWLGMLGLLGLLVAQALRPLPVTLRGWERACYQAPHKRLTPSVLKGLHQAKVHQGHRGWQPTVAWVNEQCQVLGLD